LTYVFWAIPPQGRPKNLGELRLDDGKAEIETSSEVQTFALIVTAEPYYAVTTPSDVVVMENLVLPETRGRTSVATLQYEIVPRGAYVKGGDYALPVPGKREPADVQQARNAVAIAKIAEADRLLPDGFATAQRLLAQSEQLVAKKKSSRDIVSSARAAVQAAEESRLRSVGRRLAEDEAAARDAEAARQKAAQDAADAAAAAVRQMADEQRRLAEEAALTAERERARAEAARIEAERARAEVAAVEANAASARARVEEERVALRAKLFQQFSEILETRDTTRGLIVNVGGVLFDTGQHTLRPAAREKLARFAGIVLVHAGLDIRSEGFTDSVGSDAANQLLSQQRADAVGRFLIEQGLPGERVTAVGYGESNPVASNDTAEGREKNRRVEVVVSGEMIGQPIGTTGH
jgi:outer membrane protein OmpA-like peptidoglycan-associated protein